MLMYSTWLHFVCKNKTLFTQPQSNTKVKSSLASLLLHRSSPPSGVPVLLHLIIQTLGRHARGHFSNSLTHQWSTQAAHGDKETLKYAVLSQPWYLWHQNSNPLLRTPTLERVCGCLINTSRNKAWRLCPQLLYVCLLPAIITPVV